MFRRIIAGSLIVGLGAAPAAAADVSGWYAGIYAGGSRATNEEMDFRVYGAQLVGPGPFERPDTYINNGLDPDFFDFLTAVRDAYPFAAFGAGGGVILHGALSSHDGSSIGVVAGYGFGNGLRVEGDVSGTDFIGDKFKPDSLLLQAAIGLSDVDGKVWTWSNLENLGFPIDPSDVPAPPEFSGATDIGLDYRTNAQFFLLNAFYDFDTGTAVAPYLGGGVGLARLSTTIDGCPCLAGTYTRWAPAAQLGGGLRISLAQPVTLDIGYRYKMAGDPGFSAVDVRYNGTGGATATVLDISGIAGVHTLQAGLTFALQ